MGVDKFGADDICIKVYDPSKQELIAIYDNYAQASKKLGLSPKAVHAACRNKTRRFSPFLKKEVAMRASAKINNNEKN